MDKKTGVCMQPPPEPEPQADESAPESAPEPLADLTRAALLAADDRELRRVDVPEWGGALFIRTLTGKERDDYTFFVQSKERGGRVDSRGLRARLLCVTLCDAEGKALLSLTDAEALLTKSARPIERLFDVALALNGLSDESIEDLEKN